MGSSFMASVVGVYGLSCLGMWDLPGPGIKPMSPALVGGSLTTGPPGKSLSYLFFCFSAFIIVAAKIANPPLKMAPESLTNWLVLVLTLKILNDWPRAVSLKTDDNYK